jgi:hypothetical protein
MSPTFMARLAAAALVLSSALAAQVLDGVRPAAFGPGALLRLTGHGLAGVASVRFTALGPGDELLVRDQPVVRAADGQLLVVAPAFADRDPGVAPLSPWGWVGVADAAPRPGFLLEGTAGRVRVAGAGTQLPDGGRLGVSFDPLSGLPAAGNGGFTLTLDGAPPGAAAIVLAGPPADGPRVRVGDAALGLDLASGSMLVGTCAVGADGTAVLRLPVPAVNGVAIAALWVVARPPGGLAFSDTLVVEV